MTAMPPNSESKVSIFIAVPNMGEIETELGLRLIEWKTNTPYFVGVYTPAYLRPIPVARNTIVREFLKGPCTWLLMIDDDIVPPPNILDLTGFGKDIISPLIFTLKEDNIIPVAVKKVGDGEYASLKKIESNSLIQVDAVGTGCLLIHRRVFSHLTPPYFKYIMDDEGFLFEGEDFNFCRRAQEKKFKIFVHSGYIAKHFVRIDLSRIALQWQT